MHRERRKMAVCPHAKRCGLQRSISMREALRVWEGFYCDRAFGRCERYKLAVLGAAVPDELLPNGRLVDLGRAAQPAAARG